MASYKYELNISSNKDNLEILKSFIKNHLTEFGCNQKMITEFLICVEEIFINISLYAYSKDGNVLIELSLENNTIEIIFTDNGIEFNPLLKEDPNITSPKNDRPIGGLGIFMIKKMMDIVSYNRIDDKNVLIIKKEIK